MMFFGLVIINSVASAVTLMEGQRDGRVPCLNLGSQPVSCFLASYKWASQAPGDDVVRGLLGVILWASSGRTDALLYSTLMSMQWHRDAHIPP